MTILSSLLRKRQSPIYKEEEDESKLTLDDEDDSDSLPQEIVDVLDSEKNNTNNTLSNHGIYYLRGEICERNITPILRGILEKDLIGYDGEVLLFVNSPGGYSSETWALIDLIHSTRIPITTIGMGIICSAGTMIVAAGDPGRRLVMPRTEIMTHTLRGGTFGTINELQANMKGFNIEHEKDIRFWTTHSKYKTKREVEKYLMKPVDTYMTAQQAVKHGIIDAIITDQRNIKQQSLYKQQKKKKKKKKKE